MLTLILAIHNSSWFFCVSVKFFYTFEPLFVILPLFQLISAKITCSVTKHLNVWPHREIIKGNLGVIIRRTSLIGGDLVI